MYVMRSTAGTLGGGHMSERERIAALLRAESETLYMWFDGRIEIEDVADALIAAGLTMPAPGVCQCLDEAHEGCRDKTLTAVGDDEWGTPGIRVPSRWDADGVPTAWIIMHQVHTETEACQDGCVIHHPLDHHMRHWRLIWRSDRGIFERLCEHGVGHPDPSQGPYWTRMGQDWQWVHGCCMDDDGKPCCARAARQIPLAEGRR